MKSFLTDRPRVASPGAPGAIPTAFAAAEVPAHLCPPPSSLSGRPPATVECIREGDRIARIIVNCSCGERVEIECLYASNS